MTSISSPLFSANQSSFSLSNGFASTVFLHLSQTACMGVMYVTLRYARSSSNASETYSVAIIEKRSARLGRLRFLQFRQMPGPDESGQRKNEALLHARRGI